MTIQYISDTKSIIVNGGNYADCVVALNAQLTEHDKNSPEYRVDILDVSLSSDRVAAIERRRKLFADF